MILPGILTLIPIWLSFLVYYFRKDQSQKTVWGFLLPKIESALGSSQNSRPWYVIILLFGMGVLCLLCFSFPIQRQLSLVLNEPHLLKNLNETQKSSWINHFKLTEKQGFKMQVLTPKGDLELPINHLEEIFNKSFTKTISESWFTTKFLSTPHMASGLSQHHGFNLPLVKSDLINSHGIYGLKYDENDLFIAVWSKQIDGKLSLSFEEETINIPSKRWQYVKLPKTAHGKSIVLSPLDSFALDNSLDTSGFINRPLNWSCPFELKPSYENLLKQQHLWVDHRPLYLIKNQVTFNTQGKSIHFIDQLIDNFSRICPPDQFKTLYSSFELPASSGHHGLQWPVDQQSNFSLHYNPNHYILWFNEDHVFAALEKQNNQAQIVHTSLVSDSFKSNLDDKAHQLILNTLYPNLNEPWLIKRDALHPSVVNHLDDLPVLTHHKNLWMAMSLMLCSLIGSALVNYKLS